MLCRISLTCLGISMPRTVMNPEVGDITPVSIRTVVVFPAPFGPKKPNISPRRIEKLIPSTAEMSLYFFTRS